MPEPIEINGKWFIETPEGSSGPWNTKEAAEAAGNDDFIRASYLHNSAPANKIVHNRKN